MNKLLLGIVTLLIASNHVSAGYTKESIMGVWKLTKFFTVDKDGHKTKWCNGATGSIAYLPSLMTVSINCKSTDSGSGAEKMGGLLFYSGPFQVDTKTNEVIHRVRNFSHPSLNQTYRRSIEMKDDNNLRLVGNLGEGAKAIVEWVREEKFSYDDMKLAGVWDLVGSENDVEGSDKKIPFCNGFYGTILYTPGGYGAVSINCGEKLDPNTVEPADQFGRKYFYSGSFYEDGKSLTQNILNVSEVNQIGGKAVRKMRFEKDLLILEGTNGSKFRAIWKKRSSFVGLD